MRKQPSRRRTRSSATERKSLPPESSASVAGTVSSTTSLRVTRNRKSITPVPKTIKSFQNQNKSQPTEITDADSVYQLNHDSENEITNSDEQTSQSIVHTLSHRVLHAPILPSLPIRLLKEKTVSSEEPLSSKVDQFLKRPPGIQMWRKGKALISEWKEMRYHNFYHEQDYKNVVIKEDITPETTNINGNNGDNDSAMTNIGMKASQRKRRRTNSNNKSNEDIQMEDFLDKESDQSKHVSIQRTIRLRPPNQASSQHQHPSNFENGHVPYVSRSCTSMTISALPTNYLAIGDSAGYVTIYTIHPIATPIIRISTNASLRAYQEEMETTSRTATNNNTSTRSKSPIPPALNHSNKTEKYIKDLFSHHPPVTKGTERNLSMAACHIHSIEALEFSSLSTPSTSDTREKSLLLTLSTKIEIEVHNLLLNSSTKIQNKNSTLLWSINTAQQWRSGPAMRLSYHPSNGILAGFFNAYPFPSHNASTEPCTSTSYMDQLMDSQPKTSLGPKHFSPLALCQKNQQMQGIIPWRKQKIKGKVEMKALRLGIQAIGIWDYISNGEYFFLSSLVYPNKISASSDSKIAEEMSLTASILQQSPTQQILKIHFKSKIIQYESMIPIKTSGSKIVGVESIRLTPNGRNLLVSSAKGIRMFDSKNLNLIKIFGEGIALHGHPITWQDCFCVVDKDYEKSVLVEKLDGLEYRLDMTSNNYEDGGNSVGKQSSPNLAKEVTRCTSDSKWNMYIVGIPHSYREPSELKETIHFWNITDNKFLEMKLPTYTLHIPRNSGGIKSLIWRKSKLLLMTQDGDCYEMTEFLYSDWPGKMYPPGYLVQEENVEYIENEDELDIVLDKDDDYCDTNGHALEHEYEDLWEEIPTSSIEDKVIDVVGGTAAEEKMIPCHPEPFLQEKVYERWRDEQVSLQNDEIPSASDRNTSGGNSTATFIFSLLPPVPDISALRQKGFKPQLKEDSLSSDIEKGKGSRTKRMGAIEAALKASIDKNLRLEMQNRECWSSPHENKNSDKDDCLACKGKMYIHTCGSRDIPVDHELIAKQLQEKEKEEKEQKEKERLAKRKATEERRKEEKRKRKLALEEIEKKSRELELQTKRDKKQAEDDAKRRKKQAEDDERKLRRALEDEERKMKKMLEEERKRRRKLEMEERKLRKIQDDEERKHRKKMEDERRKRFKYLQKLQKEEEKATKKRAMEAKKFALKQAKAQKLLIKKLAADAKKKKSKSPDIEKTRKYSRNLDPVHLASLISAYATGASIEVLNSKLLQLPVSLTPTAFKTKYASPTKNLNTKPNIQNFKGIQQSYRSSSTLYTSPEERKKLSDDAVTMLSSLKSAYRDPVNVQKPQIYSNRNSFHHRPSQFSQYRGPTHVGPPIVPPAQHNANVTYNPPRSYPNQIHFSKPSTQRNIMQQQYNTSNPTNKYPINPHPMHSYPPPINQNSIPKPLYPLPSSLPPKQTNLQSYPIPPTQTKRTSDHNQPNRMNNQTNGSNYPPCNHHSTGYVKTRNAWSNEKPMYPKPNYPSFTTPSYPNISNSPSESKNLPKHHINQSKERTETISTNDTAQIQTKPRRSSAEDMAALLTNMRYMAAPPKK